MKPLWATSLPKAESVLMQGVYDLLHWDMEQAMRAAQAPVHGAGSAALTGQHDMPRLLAIYGRGQKLWAEVSLGSQRMVFQRGHEYPLGRERMKDGLRLGSLDSQCVVLLHEQHDIRLCMEP